jgi:hypothetical protein
VLLREYATTVRPLGSRTAPYPYPDYATYESATVVAGASDQDVPAVAR